jgi:hypothetical protein
MVPEPPSVCICVDFDLGRWAWPRGCCGRAGVSALVRSRLRAWGAGLRVAACGAADFECN